METRTNKKVFIAFSLLLSFSLLSCEKKNSGLNQFNQYFDSFNLLVEKMNAYQTVHEEKEKLLFEISGDYGCKSTYGIRGVCYCSLNNEKHASHKEGDECPYFYYREPFFKLNNGEAYYDDCFVYYREKNDFDYGSLSWDVIASEPDSDGSVLRPNQYYLKDKNGYEITKVECFEHFEKREQLLNDIIDILKQ